MDSVIKNAELARLMTSFKTLL